MILPRQSGFGVGVGGAVCGTVRGTLGMTTLALLLSAGSALAQGASSSSASPTGTVSGAPSPASASGTSVVRTQRESVRDDTKGRRVKLDIENDQVVLAEWNGVAVPAERIVRDGDSIKLMDESGGVLYEYTRSRPVAPPAPAYGVTPSEAPRALRAYTISGNASRGGVGGIAGMDAAQESRRKSMIGVVLGEVEGALRGHFGLKPGEATLVYSVSDGLAADQAGLAPYDIIVGIEGKNLANEEFVRATLREKEAGSQVQLRVLHRGVEKTVTVTPEKYDAEKLAKAKRKSLTMDTMEDGVGTPFAFPQNFTINTPEVKAFARLGVISPEVERAFESMTPELRAAMEETFRSFHEQSMDEPGDEPVEPESATDDDSVSSSNTGGASAGSPEAIAARARDTAARASAARARELADRAISRSGRPLIATIPGPNGTMRTQVFVSPNASGYVEELRARLHQLTAELDQLHRQREINGAMPTQVAPAAPIAPSAPQAAPAALPGKPGEVAVPSQTS